MPYKNKDKQREAQKAHYRRNAVAVKRRTSDNKLKYHKERTEIVRAAKDVRCADCGIKYPRWVMQFDHVRGVKHFTIASHMNNFGIPRLKEEIAKCEVVCANCHAERTHARIERKHDGSSSTRTDRDILGEHMESTTNGSP